MEISPRHQEDIHELQRLYHDLNPEVAGSIRGEVRHESENFVAKDESGVSGLALVSLVDYGLYPYGIIHEFSLRPSSRNEVKRALLDSCIHWLAERGAVSVTSTASNDEERAFLNSQGFEDSKTEMERVLPVQAARRFIA